MIRTGTYVPCFPANTEFDLREFFANERDAANLVDQNEFATFWNSLTMIEKQYYLNTDLPRRVFTRMSSSDDI